jgi:hypothetical protein
MNYSVSQCLSFRRVGRGFARPTGIAWAENRWVSKTRPTLRNWIDGLKGLNDPYPSIIVAANKVFTRSMAMVIRPTPPGTGDNAEATSATPG